MKEIKNQSPQQPVPHPHAKLLLIISAVIVIASFLAVGVFGLKTIGLKNEKKTTDTTPPMANQEDVDPKKVSEELKSLDLAEIKSAVADIKSIVDAF